VSCLPYHNFATYITVRLCKALPWNADNILDMSRIYTQKNFVMTSYIL